MSDRETRSRESPETTSSELSDQRGDATTPAFAKVMRLRRGDAAGLAAIVVSHPREARGIMEFAAPLLGNAAIQRAFQLLESGDAPSEDQMRDDSPNTPVTTPVQMKGNVAPRNAPAVHAAAERGRTSASTSLPFAERIQSSFGPSHDVSNVRAHIDPASTAAIGASAYASGRDVVFEKEPDLHTAAHEAAHVVQQAKGVNLYGGVGEAGDAHEKHADAVADRVVSGQSAADLLGSSTAGATSQGGAVQMKPKEGEADASSAHQDAATHETGSGHSPVVPVEHEAGKIKLEFGHGSVTGGITLRLEHGTTGIPLGDDRLKALKNTVSLKVNGFVMKLETALLNGKLEDEILDGVNVSIETKMLKLSSDGKSLSADLLTVALKLSGDVGHWIDAGPDVKILLDGEIQIALGGKLAEQLSKYTIAALEREMLVKEIDTVGETVAQHTVAVKDLESELAAAHARSATRREIEALEQKIFAHKIQISTGTQELKGLMGRLSEAKSKAAGAFSRLKGGTAKLVAKAMEVRGIKFATKALGKLIPILNLASTISDVIDLIHIIRTFIKGTSGPGGDSHDGPESAGGGHDDSGKHDGIVPDAGTPAANTPASDTSGHVGGEASKADPKAIAEARKALSPPARTIIDAISHLVSKNTKGAELDPDQLKMLNLLIPSDLKPDEVREVISVLHRSGATAMSAPEAFVAIEGAVREVRNHQRTVSVDGTARADLADPDHAPITSPSQVSGTGTISRPAQGDTRTAPADSGTGPDEALVTVGSAPPHVIGRWFQERTGELVLSDVGNDWKGAHINAAVGHDVLIDLQPVVSEHGDGKWTLRIVFTVRSPVKGIYKIEHTYMVSRGGDASGLGAKVGNLVFEPFQMIGQ